MKIFAALLLDAYRELNSKRLFWVILILSAMFVLVYASMGFDESGVFLFFGLWHIDNELLVHGSPMSAMLYRGIFSTFVVPIWLAWIATILALISTGSIFPDFVAGGSIDVVLSKPIGRVRLFFYKYIASLLFVLLQVSLFCAGVFLCMGWRLADWDWRIFLAIPIVVVFYSYLFSVCVLIGVWTRSALAALLLTLLLWFGLYAINQTEIILNLVSTEVAVQMEDHEQRITELKTRRDELRAQESDEDAAAIARVETEIANAQKQHGDVERMLGKLTPWRGGVRTIQIILPKTSETIALLDRALKRETDVNLMDLFTGNVSRDSSGGFMSTDTSRDRRVRQRLEDEYTARSLWYVLGTSLIFEAVVLALACWIFVRRDY
jgi:ABC-type transport system involved in multi-copper enzyme maturation permease subunit